MATRRLKFTDTFDYQHKNRSITSYAKGSVVPVPESHAELALALGKAEEVPEGSEPNDADTVQGLVEGNSRDQLVQLAMAEGVGDTGTKAELAERIIAKRAGQ